ncbi:hypothetical protein MHYP_G00062480 [Metynnis hypsauchen]
MAGLQSLFCLFWLGSVQAGKLLVIPADGSHWTGMKPLVEELGRRGNQVVVVIPEESLSMGPAEHTTMLTFPVPYTKAKIQELLSSTLDDFISRDTSTDLGGLLASFLTVETLKTRTVRNTESLLHSQELMKTLKDWDFDAILTDPFDPKGVIVGEFLNISSIYIQVNHPCGAHFLASQCPSPVSYIPHRYTQYSNQMGFFRRTVNMVRALLQPLACRRLFSHADEIASRFLQRETSMMEIMSRSALSLMRFDFAFEFPRPVMPNMVMIGGFSVPKPKPLPQCLENPLHSTELVTPKMTSDLLLLTVGCCAILVLLDVSATFDIIDHELLIEHVEHVLGTVRGEKIVVMPVDGSHWLSMKILVEELSQKGHEMVVLVPEANYHIRNGSYTTRTFKVPYTKADLDASLDMIKKGMLKAPGFFDIVKTFEMIMNFTEMQVKGCEGLLYDEPLMRSLREQGFDLMLTDPFLPCGTIIADAFSIPAVYFLRGMICGLDVEAAQCPSPPSYVPRLFTGNTDAMTFPQRVKNMLMVGVESILCHTLYCSFDELASRYLEKDTTYKQLLGLGAIWFMRYDFTFEYPRPIMPNMVMVGGLNCAKKKPLPVRETSMMEIMSRADLWFLRFDFAFEFPQPVMPNMVMIRGFSVPKPKLLPQISFGNDTAMIHSPNKFMNA